MTPWNIHPAAQEEHDEQIEAFAKIDQSLAIAFEESYLKHRQSICSNPLSYNLRREPVRRVNLTPRFGEYYIAYMIWCGKVVILAAAHPKRRPYYWRKRIGEAEEMF